MLSAELVVRARGRRRGWCRDAAGINGLGRCRSSGHAGSFRLRGVGAGPGPLGRRDGIAFGDEFLGGPSGDGIPFRVAELVGLRLW